MLVCGNEISVSFRLTSCDVRELCIANNWYTQGYTFQYSDMLEKCDFTVKTQEALTKHLYIIATDITKHSNTEGICDIDYIQHVMFILMRKVDTFFDIK